MENGSNVPQTGPTVFTAELKKKFLDVYALLRDPTSWELPEPVVVGDKKHERDWDAAEILPEEARPKPWLYAKSAWIHNWLSQREYVNTEYKYPDLSVRTLVASRRSLIRLRRHAFEALLDLEETAWRLSRFILNLASQGGSAGFCVGVYNLPEKNRVRRRRAGGIS
jgi:hypothetical protein